MLRSNITCASICNLRRRSITASSLTNLRRWRQIPAVNNQRLTQRPTSSSVWGSRPSYRCRCRRRLPSKVRSQQQKKKMPGKAFAASEVTLLVGFKNFQVKQNLVTKRPNFLNGLSTLNEVPWEWDFKRCMPKKISKSQVRPSYGHVEFYSLSVLKMSSM